MSRADPYAEIERTFASPEASNALGALSGEQRATLCQYWLDRAEGELTTALTFEFSLDDLRELGAPAPLLALAQTAIADELRHTEWCLRWARAVDPGAPELPSLSGTRPAVFEGASEHDNRLLRTVFGGCFSETIAVHILREAQRHITLSGLRRLNHEHLREEVGHARLGWALLGWPGLSQRDRDMIRAHVPELSQLARAVWQTSRRAPDPALHALGYLSCPIVDAGYEEAQASVILPGLERLGIASG